MKNSKPKNILIIDDDPISNLIHDTLIENLGYAEKVNTVENGWEALQFLINNPAPDLILLDLMMPVMDGFKFLELYKELPIQGKEDIKIVALTAAKGLNNVMQAIQLGADDFVMKPVSKPKMQEIFEENF
jgi:CheY-like chemotaxis protein